MGVLVGIAVSVAVTVKLGAAVFVGGLGVGDGRRVWVGLAVAEGETVSVGAAVGAAVVVFVGAGVGDLSIQPLISGQRTAAAIPTMDTPATMNTQARLMRGEREASPSPACTAIPQNLQKRLPSSICRPQ